MHKRSILGFTAFTTLSLGWFTCAIAQETPSSEVLLDQRPQAPTKPPQTVHIQFSSKVKAHTNRLLIRNQSNGRQVFVSFSRDFELNPQTIAYLTNEGKDALNAQYGLVYAGHDRQVDPGFSEIDSQLWIKSTRATGRDPYFVEWLNVHEDEENGHSTFVLDQKAATRELEDAQAKDIAQKAQKLNKEQAVQQARKKANGGKATALLDEGWSELGKRAYDKSLKSFDEALKLDALAEAAQAKAYFGRGLSSFHQKSCDVMEYDFKEAEKEPEFRDDINYYRALCDVDQNRLEKAKERFTAVVAANHPQYTDASRFYLGIIAEKEERFDDAEGTYADTVDFAKDERVVALAKAQLATLQAKRAAARYNSKLVTLMASLGVGYDSNVIALPPSVTPASVSLKSKGSSAYQALLYADVRNPYFFGLKQRFTYSFLNVGYFNGQLAIANNLISHDFGMTVELPPTATTQNTLGLSYNLTRLGEFGASNAYLDVTTLHWDFIRPSEPQGRRPRVYLGGLKLSHYQPRQPAASPDSSQIAMSLGANGKIKYQIEGGAIGPLMEIEFKKSSGKENTYIMGTPGAFIEKTLGPEVWHLSAVADISLPISSYYASDSSRFDKGVRYSAGLSRQWVSYIESRLQFIGTSNFSNISASYRYDRYQLNFLTTAFF